MERSTAIISSNIGCRLAVRRRTNYALVTQKDTLRRYLNEEEAGLVRSVLPDQWSLDPLDGQETIEKARDMFETNPDEFVAKNVLRPRTGSGKTQDRTESGGMILKSENEIRELFSNPFRARHYILYRKIKPKTHDSIVHHESNVYTLRDTAISELAMYGSYLVVNGERKDDTTGHKHVIRSVFENSLAGIGSRTSVLPSIDSALAKSLGYGAISAVYVS